MISMKNWVILFGQAYREGARNKAKKYEFSIKIRKGEQVVLHLNATLFYSHNHYAPSNLLLFEYLSSKILALIFLILDIVKQLNYNISISQ